MLTFYDNALSPFARKVRVVLEFKGLEFDSLDHAIGQPRKPTKK